MRGPGDDRVGQRLVLVTGLLLMAAGVATWMGTRVDGGYLTHMLPGIVVMSLGQGLAYTSLTAASLTDVTNDQHGVAGAFNITAQQIGASIGTAALVAIVASVTHTDDPIDRLGGYHLAYLTIACLLAVGTVVTAVLFGRPRTD